MCMSHMQLMMQCPQCLRRHPISECSASTADRRRRPGSASSPPPARSSSISESSEQLPSIAPRWPHSESQEPRCDTTWPAVRRLVALRSSLAGVVFRADGCLPSDGRARSESVSASCAMVGWALSIGHRLAILTLDAYHVQAPLRNGKAGAQSDSHTLRK